MYSSIRVIFPSRTRPTIEIHSAGPTWPLCITPLSEYWITNPSWKTLMTRSLYVRRRCPLSARMPAMLSSRVVSFPKKLCQMMQSSL